MGLEFFYEIFYEKSTFFCKKIPLLPYFYNHVNLFDVKKRIFSFSAQDGPPAGKVFRAGAPGTAGFPAGAQA